MQQQTNPKEKYNQQITNLSGLLKKLKTKRTNIGWLRLFIVLGTLVLVYSLFFTFSILIWLLVAAGIGGFLFAVTADVDNNDKIADTETLLAINNSELAALNGDYQNREDGFSFSPPEHPYAGDLDLFGKTSLYQYINRCTSQQSKKLLAISLLRPAEVSTILKRQEGAKTLAPLLEWRQRFQSTGMAQSVTFETEQKIINWIALPQIFRQSFYKFLPAIFTTITLATLIAYMVDWLQSAMFLLLIFTYYLIAKFVGEKVIESCLTLSNIEAEINTIYQQLQLVENLPVQSSVLDTVSQSVIVEKKGTKAIKELKGILKNFDFRLNPLVFFVLNTFFLWDVRQAINLNNWRQKYAELVPIWFEVLSEVELLNTLATLTFNHPDWIFPSITESHFTFSATQLGHPLINKNKRVDNTFETKGTGKVNIITGSNMAGKSTFLRSVAINLVLAQAGAPVCADEFTFSPVYLFSSMRIADNLAENTSTFYAELKKLKSIIDEVKQHKKVFILLDEILRGTNSLDRHTGSEALIKQLIREGAVAVIATHDVELAKLEIVFTNAVTNYHFDVQVAAEELYFDYKLKRGVCQSMNASLLMKKIGLEL